MTPTRDELDAVIAALGVTYDMWWGDVADRILPLLLERDAEIERLDAEIERLRGAS